jgi:glycerol uptake facilitator-like aquaporin
MNKLTAPAMELVATAILAVAIVGSGFMATDLTKDLGLTLLINGLVIASALVIVISISAPISGAHLNPVVTLILLLKKRIDLSQALLFVLAQILGAIGGALFANYLFTELLMQSSDNLRSGTNLFLSEVFATAGLLWIILANLKKPELIKILVPLFIFGAIFFTPSTAFANPAITIARSFTDSFTGIDLHSVPAFLLAQLIGALIGLLLANLFDREIKHV